MELLEKFETIENVKLDEASLDEFGFFIDFSVGELNYAITVIKWGGTFEATDVSHSFKRDAYCAFCEKIGEKEKLCELSFQPNTLNELVLFLRNKPSLRLKFLLNEIVMK